MTAPVATIKEGDEIPDLPDGERWYFANFEVGEGFEAFVLDLPPMSRAEAIALMGRIVSGEGRSEDLSLGNEWRIFNGSLSEPS